MAPVSLYHAHLDPPGYRPVYVFTSELVELLSDFLKSTLIGVCLIYNAVLLSGVHKVNQLHIHSYIHCF